MNQSQININIIKIITIYIITKNKNNNIKKVIRLKKLRFRINLCQ